jgi:hypothetical protein
MNKIFISYSSKNADWVKTRLVPKLESHGVPAHVDYRDFRIGTAAAINMEYAIEECAKTLLVFTPDYVQSDFALFEAIMLQTGDPLNSKRTGSARSSLAIRGDQRHQFCRVRRRGQNHAGQ